MAAYTVRPVSGDEAVGLLREAVRLIELGADASEVERSAYRERRIDLLERTAGYLATKHEHEGDRGAVQVAMVASRDAQMLRLGLPSIWGEI